MVREMGNPVKDVVVLGIETSCDETAVALVQNGVRVLSNLVVSQTDVHRVFGGIVPEVASRKHIETIAVLVQDAFLQAGLAYRDIDAVAVTNTPGLIGALLVGVSFAKAFAYGLGKPLIAVNHLKAHIFANCLQSDFEAGRNEVLSFPCVSLVVSGGHTSLIYMQDLYNYEVLGETRDDAAGEVFDKVARFLGLGYPGGPAIEKAAAAGQPGVYRLPRPVLEREEFEFSFSGLKTATINLFHQITKKGQTPDLHHLAAEFQEAVVDVLVEKTLKAAAKKGAKSIWLAGGVAANSRLRERMAQEANKKGLGVSLPPKAMCTDNAAMVAACAYHQFLRQDFAGLDLNAYPSVDLASW